MEYILVNEYDLHIIELIILKKNYNTSDNYHVNINILKLML